LLSGSVAELEKVMSRKISPEILSSDRQLQLRVIDALAFEPSIDSANIGVAINHAVATLTGHVSTYTQKLAAERAVWRVKGIKAIAQEIEVRSANDRKLADDQIAERATKILEWDVMVPKNKLRVSVSNGVVTLSGSVNWQFERRAAEEDIAKLNGVVAIKNDIEIVPETRAANIRERITGALQRCAEIQANQLQIDVRENGLVVLEGTVDNWDELQAIESAAWSVPGVSQIEQRIVIA
jgi:osmotically-inducible protein OsmY